MGDCHTPDGTDIRYRINRDNRSMIPQHSIHAGEGGSQGEDCKSAPMASPVLIGGTGGCIAGAHGSDVSRIFQFAEIVLGNNGYPFHCYSGQATAEDVITLSQPFQSTYIISLRYSSDTVCLRSG